MNDDELWSVESSWSVRGALKTLELELPEREGIEVLEQLSAKGWDASAPVGARGETLLMLAAACGKLGIIEWLAHNGADLERLNGYGKGVLCYAASGGLDRVVLTLDALMGPDLEQGALALMTGIEVHELGPDALCVLAQRAPLGALLVALERLGSAGKRNGVAWGEIAKEWSRRESHALDTLVCEVSGCPTVLRV